MSNEFENKVEELVGNISERYNQGVVPHGGPKDQHKEKIDFGWVI